MSKLPMTVTEQLMANKLARKPFSQQTPGDVLREAFEQAAPDVQISGEGTPDGTLLLQGWVDLEHVARVFLGKVMASG